MTSDELEARSKRNFMDHEFGRSGNIRKSFESGLVFLIMPIGTRNSDYAFEVYRSECKRQGLTAVRVDDEPSSGLILKDIVESIEKAEFIICDLSTERPNVYYELGYAHGVGNEAGRVFLTAEEGTKLHFDVSPFRVHFYRGRDGLREYMKTTFKDLVRASRKAK